MPAVSHLKRLSAVKSNGGVKFLTPAAFPGSHCPLHPALALAGNIKGLSSLVVGTPECATYSRIVLANTQVKPGEQHWTYVLDASEVVFGCRQGLMEALQKLDQAGAKAVLLLATCVPELTGEDIEGLVREAQPKLSARLTCVMLGHFKCNSFPAGSWKTLQAIGTLMEPRTVRPQVINVLGRSPGEKHIPLPPILRALKQQGFSLRCLSPGSALDDFLAAPDAALNLVLSPFADPLAAAMEQSFGIPAFRLHTVYAAAEIDALYAAIAEKLGLQWGNEFNRERLEALSLQEQARKRLHGCRYICAHIGPVRALPLAAFLAAMGMEPVLLHLEEFWPDDKQWAEVLQALGYDPLVCHMVNSGADAPLLASLAPDLCLGDVTGAKVRFPCVPYLSDLYGLSGYERTSSLLRKLLHALEQPSVVKEGGARHGLA
ncbi:nitrogenase component 1 [Sporomusa termitida]|uniref:NifE: nitrogenase MoFe cofactor biosynthesis protein NifE n=1 Tax=Sporomusa termitida TaxID=2377 RepID=A0A517E1C4_9FIRM|nr:nitrogenase component 1 [Sporomusa termitida]QDR83405.1 nifE: nitrogenase MoFe cofactor biosynthesis protein NifE [Sporomusa termitida]